jgi:hypothetical protein
MYLAYALMSVSRAILPPQLTPQSRRQLRVVHQSLFAYHHRPVVAEPSRRLNGQPRELPDHASRSYIWDAFTLASATSA